MSKTIVLITKTEEKSSDNEEDNIPFSVVQQARKEHTTIAIEVSLTGEACVGKTVVKEFAEGLFKGTFMKAIKTRVRYLYHVVYEDGDEEDLNDKEFRQAYDLCNQKISAPLESLVVDKSAKDSDNEIENSGGETEVSEYDYSDEERDRNKKKRRTGRSMK